MSEKKFNAQARLFAGSLARDTTTEEIEEMFSKFGEIGQVYHNKEGTYAFVNFVSLYLPGSILNEAFHDLCI